MVGLSQLRSMLAIEHVDRLLQLQDFAFVDAVFQAFLGRAPDAKGGSFYLSRLRAGIGKAQIILEIAESQEAKSSNAAVGGLQELIRAQKSAGRGGFLGFFSRAIRVERQTNQLESQIDLLANENRIRLADLAMAVSELERSVLFGEPWPRRRSPSPSPLWPPRLHGQLIFAVPA